MCRRVRWYKTMTQILVFGMKGSGKTLWLTKMAHEAYEEGRTVYSNVKFKFPHTPLNRHMINTIMQQDSLQDAFIALDELHTIADCRRSMSKRNVNWGYFFTQSRKRNVDIVATTQFPGQVDLRYRMNCDYSIECQKMQFKKRFVVFLTWYNHQMFIRKHECMRHPERYFKLYNTNQIIYYDFEGETHGNRTCKK